ncbi:MAG: ribosome biogenesis GTP-binding protein YihA/YsxC [Oscillospiraceae bacterium]|jgi:GTP-binding protein|nr:ribosome biogenesis GTP-binding protein YihA/YsxC [Oscillospiraceae bacterium]
MNLNQFAFEAAFGTARQLPPSTLPEIAFAGRSNVGKSSLLNCLLRRKSLARVSGTPGKTVTVNFYSNGKMRLTDLPGYGYARRSKGELARFANLMEGYFQQNRNIALVVQLIDLRHPPSCDDETMLRFLHESKLPFVVVLTKSDKLKPMQLARRMEEMQTSLTDCGAQALVPFSSETGKGRAELLLLLEAAAGANEGGLS